MIAMRVPVVLFMTAWCLFDAKMGNAQPVPNSENMRESGSACWYSVTWNCKNWVPQPQPACGGSHCILSFEPGPGGTIVVSGTCALPKELTEEDNATITILYPVPPIQIGNLAGDPHVVFCGSYKKCECIELTRERVNAYFRDGIPIPCRNSGIVEPGGGFQVMSQELASESCVGGGRP